MPLLDDFEGGLCFLRREKQGVAAIPDTRYRQPLHELVGAYERLVELARQREVLPDATGGSVAI